MKSKFKFDAKTGTMIPSDAAVAQAIQAKVHKEIESGEAVAKPIFDESHQINEKSATTASRQQVVKMQRVDAPTSVQLVDNKGLPEAYLDTVSTGVMMFRELEDYDICQISDEKTGKVLAYIGGYALQINFNMSELRTMERIEQCLQGIVKLFRHKIMTQTLDKTSSAK